MKLFLLLFAIALPVQAATPEPNATKPDTAKIAALEQKIASLEVKVAELQEQRAKDMAQTEKWIDELHDKIRHVMPGVR